MNMLEIQNCTICYQNGTSAVSDVSLSVSEGEIVSIVGESGSGKTTLIRAILGLLPPGGKVTGGSILFGGRDLVKMKEQEIQEIRGHDIAMIFQDVGAALDPIQKIKTQYSESIAVHEKKSAKEYFELAVSMLKKMHLTDTKRVMESYPFELSGGMCQRIMIAMAIVSNADLLIADEPTTALDLTVQAVVLNEIKKLRDAGMSIMLITHDLGIVAQMADYVYVMNDGKIVESGNVFDIFDHPQHEYTKTLLGAAEEKQEVMV